ncbi:MAG: glycoside hydrolase family 19 protein [Burkholderiaceae bacterium]
MFLTADQLAACTGAALSHAQVWLDPLRASMGVFEITSPLRVAAFLANVGHESGRLVYAREIWGPTDAQRGYEGRKDLGNLRVGDGRKYLGRGPIQVTGHANYIATRDGLRRFLPNVPDFERSPELLELPRWGAYAAGLFWYQHGINAFADAGDFDGVCDVINRGRKTPRDGDSNGFAERLAFYRAGLRELGIRDAHRDQPDGSVTPQ